MMEENCEHFHTGKPVLTSQSQRINILEDSSSLSAGASCSSNKKKKSPPQYYVNTRGTSRVKEPLFDVYEP